MPLAIDVTLPELGEGIEKADVVRVFVATGETVTTAQPLLEIETDKATVEIPSPAAGIVRTVAVEPGTSIAVGQLIVSLSDDDQAAPETLPQPGATRPERPVQSASQGMRTPRDASLAPTLPSANAEVNPPTRVLPQRRTLAAPSVRKLAQELDVDINAVEGTGGGGRVRLDDVSSHAPHARVERIRLRHLDAKLTPLASKHVPHGIQYDQADLSEFEAIRRTIERTSPDLPLTITAFTMAVTAAALKRFPQFNASLDAGRDKVILKRDINIGVTVDTPRGLVVPVVTAADRKSVSTLAHEIANLTAKARSNVPTPRDRENSSFTIRSLGEFGGTVIAPAVNFPEVSILGLARSAIVPTYVNGVCQPRPLLPLSLSYDPRLIEDVDGIRFLRWLATRLEHPLLLEL